MSNYLFDLFDTSGFPPRWKCGIWSDALGWMHIGSDVAIFAAYTAIPLVLAYFVVRRPNVPFPKILWLFVAFIFFCGFGHLLEAIIFWHPLYRFAGGVKLVTAVVSWATVVALLFVIPTALRFPQLSRLNTELQQTNESLQRTVGQEQERTGTLEAEVDERRRTEELLIEHTRQIEQFNRLAVGRELRMIELKREINRLAARLGEAEHYELSDEMEIAARG